MADKRDANEKEGTKQEVEARGAIYNIIQTVDEAVALATRR